MRRDGIADIANQIQPALGNSTSKDAINAIAADMARFYASDVVYKDYATPLIAGALHDAGIAVGGANGADDRRRPVPARRRSWLQPSLRRHPARTSRSPTAGGKPAPGLHGHSLDSVSVGGTTLQTGSTNTIAGQPAADVHAQLHQRRHEHRDTTSSQGDGQRHERSAARRPCRRRPPGSTPPARSRSAPRRRPGNYTVTATIEPVPGEKNTANNTLSFPVTFQ